MVPLELAGGVPAGGAVGGAVPAAAGRGPAPARRRRHGRSARAARVRARHGGGYAGRAAWREE